MARTRSSGSGSDGEARFRVSDTFVVPLRGQMLRLRLVEGRPSIKDVAPGRTLRLEGSAGRERRVTIVDHAATGGRQTQERLDRTRELDIVISAEDAGTGDERVAIGWFAGPASG
jgi:hypothetical protein